MEESMTMLKSNRIMCLLFAVAIIVLVLGQNSASAVSLDSQDNMTIDADNTARAIDNPEYEESKTVKKDSQRNVKNSPEEVTLSMEDVEADFGEVADMNVITTPVVDEGIISWYINEGIVGARNLSNSPASLPVDTTNYVPGTYTVEARYTGSLIHNTASTTALLKINPMDSYVDNVVTNFNDDNDIDVTLNMRGDEDIISYGNFYVYHGNELIKSLELEDEDVSFTIDKKYNNEVLTFEWVGDEYYRSCRTNYLVSVPKFRSNIYMAYPNGFQGSVISQPVTFYSDRLVNDGVLDVYVDGDLIEEYNVTGGVVVDFDLSEYSAGVYDVYLDYYGSDVYEDSSYATTLTVRQVNTTLYTYNVSAHKNDTVYLRAGVYNYVDDTSEGMIEFFLDGRSIKTGWVNSVTVNESYVIPDSLDFGEHELKVVYYGSNRYSGATGYAVLSVDRYANSLSVRNVSLSDVGRVVVNVREYSYNMSVDDGILDYYVDGELVGSVPVTGNITCIVLPEEYSGDNEYELLLCYHGSGKFEDASLNTSIHPTKTNTSTRLYTYTSTENKLNLTSYVYSANYANISEGSVEFYINDTMIGSSSVENNMANMIVDMDQYEDKTYQVKAVYTGSKIYRTSQNNTNINYKRNQKAVNIQTPGTINTKASNTITITVNLTDYDQNKLPIQTKINISILGNEHTIQTTNGTGTFTYTIPSDTPEGTYNITMTSQATKDYKEAKRTIKLNIIKEDPYITSQNTIRTIMGEKIQINATLNLNHEILRENIIAILKINNKTIYQGMFQNGEFQYKLTLNKKYTDEKYNITIISIENSQYHRAEKNIELQLSPRNTYITSHNIESKNGEQIIIDATIYDSLTRTPVKGTSKACIKINDVTLDNINVVNGHLVYSYNNDYSSKDYNIKIIYGRNKIYNNSTWNGTLTIKSSKLKIATHNIQTQAYKTINIKANILAENKLATGPIKTVVKINNKTIHEQNITNGKLSFNYTLPEEVGSGKYNLTIIAGDTRKYVGETNTVNLTVNKNYKQIITDNITATPQSKVKIRAKIVDIENNTVTVNTKVNIKINQQTITDMNVTDGIIDYDYTLPETLRQGTYNLLIQAGETSGYYHATTITHLKVE